MRLKKMMFTGMLVVFAVAVSAQSNKLSLGGFRHWLTGHDEHTLQLLPAQGNDALTIVGSDTVAHVKFRVGQYGEMSFPINNQSVAGEEALSVNLTGSKFILLRYKSNHTLVLQLRQTGVHGGVHNHVVLPPASTVTTRKILFADFRGGLKPLDLSDVAKFNFAFLGNQNEDGFAELVVEAFTIDQYRP